MEEYRELRTEATRFRRIFFLVAHASLTGAVGKLRVSPCARGCRLPFHPPSLSLFRAKHRVFPSLFRPDQVSTHPTQNCISPYLTMPYYATPHQNVFFSTWLFRLLSCSTIINILIYLACKFFIRFQFPSISVERILNLLICPVIAIV